MNNTLIPTQLFVGNGIDLIQHVEQYLQQRLCSNPQEPAGCFCTSCRQIKNHQHQKLLWLKPERDYKLQDIEVIFERTAFSLDQNDHYFFVLEQADTFNVATGNRLLKLLEEPPTGYNFILMTNNEDAILKTIVSRCHIVRLDQTQEDASLHPLLAFFMIPHRRDDPFAFEQLIKQLHLSDNQSVQLANQLMNQLFQKMTLAYEQDIEIVETYQGLLSIVQKALLKPPQSGSSEIFWKNIYLQFDAWL